MDGRLCVAATLSTIGGSRRRKANPRRDLCVAGSRGGQERDAPSATRERRTNDSRLTKRGEGGGDAVISRRPRHYAATKRTYGPVPLPPHGVAFSSVAARRSRCCSGRR